MAELIQVNFGALGNSAQTLKSTASALQNEMQSLNSDLQAMYGSWLGTSSDAAQALIKKLINETNDVANQINAFSTQVTNAQQSQQQLENSITQLFSGASS
jgi:WXG100 family type VII secretion target